LRKRQVKESLQEYARGVAGGLVFSLPLLYTMEVWWAGFTSHPFRLCLYVAATFVLLLGYNTYAGLRRDASFAEVVIDSVEEMGLGIIISTVALFLIGRVTFEMSLSEAVGQVVIEAMTVAIGVSVGTAQLGGGGDEGSDDESAGEETVGDNAKGAQQSGKRQSEKQQSENQSKAGNKFEDVNFIGQLVIAFCGAVLFAANVAPTEEITMIAVEINAWRLLGLALVSLLLAALVLYASEFMGAQEFVHGGGESGIVDVLRGTVVTYAVALIASAAILWFFGRFDGVSADVCLAQTIVLAVAGVLGASAGRLLLQQQ